MSILLFMVVWIGLSIWMEEKQIIVQPVHWNSFGFLMGAIFSAL